MVINCHMDKNNEFSSISDSSKHLHKLIHKFLLVQKQDYFGMQAQGKSVTPRGPNVGNLPHMSWKFKLLIFLLCVIALFGILDVSFLSAVATLKAYVTVAFCAHSIKFFGFFLP